MVLPQGFMVPLQAGHMYHSSASTPVRLRAESIFRSHARGSGEIALEKRAGDQVFMPCCPLTHFVKEKPSR